METSGDRFSMSGSMIRGHYVHENIIYRLKLDPSGDCWWSRSLFRRMINVLNNSIFPWFTRFFVSQEDWGDARGRRSLLDSGRDLLARNKIAALEWLEWYQYAEEVVKSRHHHKSIPHNCPRWHKVRGSLNRYVVQWDTPVPLQIEPVHGHLSDFLDLLHFLELHDNSISRHEEERWLKRGPLPKLIQGGRNLCLSSDRERFVPSALREMIIRKSFSFPSQIPFTATALPLILGRY